MPRPTGDGAARQAADTLADEVVAFVRAAVDRLGLQDEPVEVVLGGGIFDTRDTAFHHRVAAGVHAAAPRAVWSGSVRRPSWVPRSSGSTPSGHPRARWLRCGGPRAVPSGS